MLERIALGQTRFSVPGVSVDTRGIAVGKYGALLFPSLDGVVGWLRLYGDEDSLDDLLPGMKLVRARTMLESRAFVLFIPAATSHVLDRAARCAKLAGGAAFTGTAKHFVRYRDERSPQGYDVVDLQPPPLGAEFLLHGEEGSQAYDREGELDARAVILKLSLRRKPGSERLDAAARAELYLSAAHGLAHGLVRYLLRSRVRTEVALVQPATESAFASAEERKGYLLARVHDLPERILENLRGVPGLTLFRGVTDNVAVEVGWAHPVSLSSCASLFARERFYLLRGARDRVVAAVDAIAGPLAWSSAEQLAEVRLPERAAEVVDATAKKPPALELEVRLVPTLNPPRRVVGTLIAPAELPHLKRLVYTLPPSMLAGHRVAVTERGALLLTRDGETVIPLGTVLCEATAGLLIPLGMDLVPRVSIEVLASALVRQAGGGRGAGLTVFPHEGGPFFVEEGALRTLERRVLARIPVDTVPIVDVSADAALGEPSIVNEPLGRFSLWGWKPRPSGSGKSE